MFIRICTLQTAMVSRLVRSANDQREPLSHGANGAPVRDRLMIVLATLILLRFCVVAPIARIADSNVLHHPADAWASVDALYQTTESIQPDISMKQALVYGRWMQALEKETLAAAAVVHRSLFDKIRDCNRPLAADGRTVAPDLAAQLRPNLPAVHSLVTAWNCSAGYIESDDSLIGTITQHANYVSHWDIKLRPQSTMVDFLPSPNRGLVADALALSLIYNEDTDIGATWNEHAATLAGEQERWLVHRDGDAVPGRTIVRILYRPAASIDKVIIAALYTLAAVYAVAGVRGTRYLDNKLAFFAAITVEVSTASFLAHVVCSCVGVNTLGVPPAVHTLVPLMHCLRNAVRLIHDMDKDQIRLNVANRISRPILRQGRTRILEYLQSVLIFLVLSNIAPSGLSSFCQFAAVSLVADMAMFHIVLSPFLTMDSRTPGLQESFSAIHRPSSQRPGAESAQSRTKSAKSVRNGFITMGALVMGLCLFLVCHFVDDLALLRNYIRHPARWTAFPTAATQLLGNFHHSQEAGLSLKWLQMQEPDTLRELLRLARPNSIKAFILLQPSLVVMTNPADRTFPAAPGAWSVARTTATAYSHRWILFSLFTPFLFVVVAFLRRDAQSGWDTDRHSSSSLVRHLAQEHTLDIFMLGSCSRRFLVSVGYDRQIRLWDLQHPDEPSQPILPDPLHPVGWPITLVSLDHQARWLAIGSKDNQIALWNCQSQRFDNSFRVESDGCIVSCLFITAPTFGHPFAAETKLLVVFETGWMTVFSVADGNTAAVRVCTEPVRSVHAISDRRTTPRLVILTKASAALVSTYRGGSWSTQPVTVSDNAVGASAIVEKYYSPITSLRGVVFVYGEERNELHLVNKLSGSLIYTLRTATFSPSSLRTFHPPPKQCVYCGSTAVTSFSIAYTNIHGRELTMHTVSPPANGQRRVGQICLRPERDVGDRRCLGLANGVESKCSVPNPGSWEATGANGIAGVRQTSPLWAVTATSHEARPVTSAGSIIERRKHEPKPQRAAQECWEAWTMTAEGVTSSHRVATQLPATKTGPLCKVAQNAVAVALANVVVLIQFGTQLRDDEEDVQAKPTHGKLSGRRSKSGRPFGS